jgi:hypothetical protein
MEFQGIAHYHGGFHQITVQSAAIAVHDDVVPT